MNLAAAARRCRRPLTTPPTLRPATAHTPRPAEKRVGEYAKAGVGAQKDQQVFSLDEDF